MKLTSPLLVFTDGGARGNPGPAGIGVVITDGKKNPVTGFGKRIGHTTNNAAEYQAVIEALSWIKDHREELTDITSVSFSLDSKLVCSQIIGVFKVKDANLRTFLFTVRELEGELKLPISYRCIPREQNEAADFFVNQALDNKNGLT